MELGKTYVVETIQNKNVTFNFDLMGVDEARQVRSSLSLKASTSDPWVVIKANAITEEAQNALLKVIEELDPNRGLAFVLPPSTSLLGTFLSRVIVASEEKPNKHPLNYEAKNFMTSNIKERLAYAKGDFPDPNILDSLLEITKNKNILYVKRLLQENAISPKMALEHLAYII